jgi:polysaccharide pyruvyl transferase WcaK-like protein
MTELTFAAVTHKDGALAEGHPKIGLLDHMGFGNMGDAAILESFIANIKKRIPDAALVAFSLNPDDTRTRHEIVTYPIRACSPTAGADGPSKTPRVDFKSRIKGFLEHFPALHEMLRKVAFPLREMAHWARTYRVVKSLDALVLSGGGQLCELWKELPYNVFKFCVLAKLSNTPLYIVGVGAGPLDRPWNKVFARWSVRLSRFTSFRDIESQNLLRDLGVRKETYVCPDPAYAIDLRDYVKGVPGCQARPVVGLNPMGFCDPRIWPRRDHAIYGTYLDTLASFARWLLAQGYDVEVFTSDIVVDHFAIEDLKKRLSMPDGLDSRLVFRPLLTLKELLNQMLRFEFVVTSKYHGVIFSHLLTKPVISLSYHPKIEALMRTVGHHQYCLDIEGFKLTSLLETFSSLVQNSEDLRSQFRRTTTIYADALKVHFDDLFGPRRRVERRKRTVPTPSH